jgi:hypothetical protein
MSGPYNINDKVDASQLDTAATANSVAQRTSDGSLNVTDLNAVDVFASGKLGVGTSSPTRAVDVISDSGAVIQVRGGSDVNEGAAFFVRNSANSSTLFAAGDRAQIFGGTPDAIGSIFTTSGVPLVFDAAGAERMRIDSAGNVGVGTTSPATFAALTVVDKGGNGTLAAIDSGLTNALYIKNSGTSASITYNDAYPLAFGTNNTERMRIDSNGKILGATASNWVGTVSTSGLSSVVERGSNANGEFVKYADGTLIMTSSFSIEHNSSSFNFSRTTPHPFIGLTVVNIHGSVPGTTTGKINTLRTGSSGSVPTTLTTDIGNFSGNFDSTVSTFLWGMVVISRWY